MPESGEAVIYWFSGTGNSLTVARSLATSLQAKLIPVMTAETDCEADCIGFVFPVHAFGIPTVMHRLVRRLHAPRVSYVFSVTTYGTYQGHPGRVLKRALSERNLHLDAAWSIRMVEIYIPVFAPPPKAREKLLLEEARSRFTAIAAAVQARQRGILEDATLLTRPLLAPVASAFQSGTSLSDRLFRTLDTCTQCAQCARICPSLNIHMGPDGPTWQHHCTQCLACIHWCPVEAIQYGPLTARHRRYRHPDVNAADLTRQRKKIEPEPS